MEITRSLDPPPSTMAPRRSHMSPWQHGANCESLFAAFYMIREGLDLRFWYCRILKTNIFCT